MSVLSECALSEPRSEGTLTGSGRAGRSEAMVHEAKHVRVGAGVRLARRHRG
jgi:hypothetical protein